MGFLSVDLGTSTVKALVFDELGQVLAQARLSYKTGHPHPGWVEQDPEDWWSATVQAIRSVADQLNKRKQNVDGIALTGQMHGPVLLARDGRPLFPCILWMDTRAQQEADEIEKLMGRERILMLTGNPSVAAFPAAKLLWLRRNVPELYGKIRMMLMPKDFLGFRLTGELATDPSDASGTLLYDLRRGRWADELVELVGIPRTALPSVVSSTQRLGDLTAEAASQVGLPRRTPVFVGAGDLATAALGNGLVRPERIGITLGTAGQILFQLQSWPVGALGKLNLFAYPVPGSFLGLGTLPTGGASLQWIVRLITDGGQSSKDEISQWLVRAKAVPRGAQGLIFLPYLAGTGTPYMDYRARGAFVGLTESHGSAEMVRAVLEGVAYSLRESLEVLRGLGIGPTNGIRLAGGAMTADVWVEVVAEVLGYEVCRVRTHDASSVGAFILAAVGRGYFDDVRLACEAIVQLEEPVKPSAAAVKRYSKGYEIFHRLYGELKETFGLLHAWNSEVN